MAEDAHVSRVGGRRRRARTAAVVILAAGTLACGGCTLNDDGEGGRFTSRVTQVTPDKICVGPSQSSSTETCGLRPDKDEYPEPGIGQCVSLFERFKNGQTQWSAQSLNLTVDDAECGPLPTDG
jgi:hypothetical protein